MKFFRGNNSFNSKYLFLSVSQFLLGLTISSRGFFWLFHQNDVIKDSVFYAKLHTVMPIWLWGLIILITGIFIMLSALYVPTIESRNIFFKLTIIGGSSSFIFYFIMLSASMKNHINWLTPINFLILTVWTFAITVISVVELIGRRKQR